MGMAAILVMWPGPFEQTFVPPSQGGYIWNLTPIGPVVSEEKMFENVDNTHTYIRTTEAYLSYKLTTEPRLRWAKNTRYSSSREKKLQDTVVPEKNIPSYSSASARATVILEKKHTATVVTEKKHSKPQ